MRIFRDERDDDVAPKMSKTALVGAVLVVTAAACFAVAWMIVMSMIPLG